MSGRRGLRDRWTDLVIAADVGPSCKLLLLVIAHKMNDRGEMDGYSRADLADLLDVHPQRIAERIREAKRAGLIGQVGTTGGKTARTARYVAVIPGFPRTADRYPTDRSGTENRYANIGTPKVGQSGRDVPVSGTPFARASENARQQRHKTGRVSRKSDSSKGGSDEDARRYPSLAADSLDRWSA
ncbi:hypothetical protein [Jatrophihabitans sp.]|uniref:hypothetical protein n=1 Tax=Jatrophihabitans sp. TaxID=1932789 RepID=UPI0030C7221C|nr:hypothetical protein [Jatrophihabitans sp.]